MNGIAISKFVGFFAVSKFLGNLYLSEQIFNRKRSLGAPDKFGLFIDLRSMADTTLHGNGQRLVNTQDGVQLTIERKTTGSGTVKCHIFSISASQMNIMSQQLQYVQF